jgi:hypothetical protein
VNKEYESDVRACQMHLTAERDCEYYEESEFKIGFSAVCVKNQCKILNIKDKSTK